MWCNQANILHLIQFDKADVTDTEAFLNLLKPELEKCDLKTSSLAFIR